MVIYTQKYSFKYGVQLNGFEVSEVNSRSYFQTWPIPSHSSSPRDLDATVGKVVFKDQYCSQFSGTLPDLLGFANFNN